VPLLLQVRDVEPPVAHPRVLRWRGPPGTAEAGKHGVYCIACVLPSSFYYASMGMTLYRWGQLAV